MKGRIIAVVVVLLLSLVVVLTSVSNSGSSRYKQHLISSGGTTSKLDGLTLAKGRNDGKLRLYSTRAWEKTQGFEFSWKGRSWVQSSTISSDAYFSSPIFADLKGENRHSLYVGGWGENGVLVSSYKKGWSKPEALTESRNKGSILAMHSGKGRNDGIDRLYVAYWKGNGGLTEFSWSGNDYTSTQLLDHPVGRFDIGQGRNDGVERIYAFERGGRKLYEFTWNGTSYISKVIYTASYISQGAVHVGDGRGDKKNRIYFWGDGLYELTHKKGRWSPILLDKTEASRFYITSGSIRKDKKPGVYVSVKKRGLHEYTWNNKKGSFNVDVISGATGGCVIGDGRGDGKARLYVTNGSKGYFTEADVVEIWESEE